MNFDKLSFCTVSPSPCFVKTGPRFPFGREFAVFETAELGRTVSRKDFKDAEPQLRQRLLELQERLRTGRDFRVILLFAGVDGAGKSEVVGLLNQWMDPRWMSTRAYDEPRDSERERPEFWRYWRDLPSRGRIGMFLSAWYSQPVLDRVYDSIDEATFIKRLDRINAFETALVQEGALILKFWMHLSQEAQEERLKALELDPATSSLVGKHDWGHLRLYDRFIEAAEQVVARTNTGTASWTIVEGADDRYRSLTETTILRDALDRSLEIAEAAKLEATKKNSAKKQAAKRKPNKAEDTSKEDLELAPGQSDSIPCSRVTVLDRLDMRHIVD